MASCEDGMGRVETRLSASTAGAWLSRIRRQTSAQIESCLFFQDLLSFLSSLNLHEFKNCFVYFFQEIMFLFLSVFCRVLSWSV